MSKDIRRMTRDAIIYALQRDLDGDEQIMKEVWEECEDQDDIKVGSDELKQVIKLIRSLK